MDINKQRENIKFAISNQHVKNKLLHDNIPFTMLTIPELNFLNILTSKFYFGKGKVLDLGCFVGGSTYALASGLFENKMAYDKTKKQIESYDLFVWDINQHDFLKYKLGFNVGDSFLNFFKQNIKKYISSVKYHEGDILKHSWHGEDIEICFIDISKHPIINDFLVQNFFPSFIEGCTIIQQDFNYPYSFWLHITMEYFKDYIEFVGDLEFNSRIYLSKKRIPKNLTNSFCYADLSFKLKENLIINQINTITNSNQTSAWLAGQLNLGLFYFWEGKKEIAKNIFKNASDKFIGDENVYKMYFNVIKNATGLVYEKR